MEVPSREFYRYLLLCGHSIQGIAAQFDRYRLLLPPDHKQYHEEQLQWFRTLLGAGMQTKGAMVRKAHMHDMLAAHKNRPAGRYCGVAFNVLSMPSFRRPVEMFLVAGYNDYEIQDGINKAVVHPFEVETGAVAAYRRYFFNPRILTAESVQYIRMRNADLDLAYSGVQPDILEYKAGLRFQDGQIQDVIQQSALYSAAALLDTAPYRTDRETMKSMAALIGAVKGFGSGISRVAKSVNSSSIKLVQASSEVEKFQPKE